MLNDRQKKMLVEKYKDAILPVTGQLIIQRKGPWMGIGYCIGERLGKFQISWVMKGKSESVVLPYDLDEVRINIGSGKWAVHDAVKTSE